MNKFFSRFSLFSLSSISLMNSWRWWWSQWFVMGQGFSFLELIHFHTYTFIKWDAWKYELLLNYFKHLECLRNFIIDIFRKRCKLCNTSSMFLIRLVFFFFNWVLCRVFGTIFHSVAKFSRRNLLAALDNFKLMNSWLKRWTEMNNYVWRFTHRGKRKLVHQRIELGRQEHDQQATYMGMFVQPFDKHLYTVVFEFFSVPSELFFLTYNK